MHVKLLRYVLHQEEKLKTMDALSSATKACAVAGRR